MSCMTMVTTIRFWQPIPSIHQYPLFEALEKSGRVRVEVRYFGNHSEMEERRQQGWVFPDTQFDEAFVDNIDFGELLRRKDELVHIIPGAGHPVLKKLLNVLINERCRWCHWGERSGIRFAKMFGYHGVAIKLLLPQVNWLFKRSYAKKINKFSLGAFAISQLAEEDFVGWGVLPSKIRHLYYSRNDQRSLECARAKSLNEPITFIYVGSISFAKGIDILIKACALLPVYGWRLILVGKDDSGGAYRHLAEKLFATDQVIWTGAVASTDINQWIAKADVLVLPSRFDGWGVVLNEGAAMGKALVSTDQVGAAWHIIKPNRNGYRVSSANVAELYECMARYVFDPSLAQQHAIESQILYRSEFTPEMNAKRLISAIDEWSQSAHVASNSQNAIEGSS